jgi:UDP-N-acetyl-2-amino-2-deoxyglucuronate dehydrogenase
MLGIAIVGCGHIAARHARALGDVEEARLVAASDVDPERARVFADTHAIETVARYPDLLARDDVGAVLVAAPATVHAELGLAAVESGRHLLSEKPIDVDLGAADRLIRSAQRRGVEVSVVSQNRFHDDVRWAHDLIASGRLGRPVAAAAFSLWSRDQAYYDAAPGRGRHDPREGGVLLNQAVHCIDLLLWIFGPARRVSCQRGRLTHEMAGEDTAALAIEFANGAFGTLQATTSIHPQEPERLELRCEHGFVVLSGGRAVRHGFREGLEVPPPPSATESAAPDPLRPFRRQHRDFARAVLDGRPPLVTAAQAREVVAFIHAADASARDGAAVTPEG